MNNAEKLIKKISDGKMKNYMQRGGYSLQEKSKKYFGYTIEEEKRNLERYKSFLNSSAYDQIKDVKVLAYLGDEEN